MTRHKSGLLIFAVFAVLALSAMLLWEPLRSAPGKVALLHAYYEGFSYTGVPADTYLPLPRSEQALQHVEKALAAVDVVGGGTAVPRINALALAASGQQALSLAATAGGGGGAANPVLAITRGALLEQAAGGQTAAERAEERAAWQQAFGSVDGVLRTGVVLASMDKPAAALRLYRRATVAYPHYREPWYYLAGVYLQQNQPQQAIAALEQGLAATQTTGRIGASNLHYRIARIRQYTTELYDVARVQQGYAQAVALGDFGAQPGDEADTHFQLGHLAFAAEQWAAALDEYQQAAALDPASYYPQVTMAAALWQLGEHEAAFQQLEAAIRRQPANALAYQWLADLQRHAGQEEQARQTLQRLLAIHPTDAAAQRALADLTLLPAYVPGL